MLRLIIFLAVVTGAAGLGLSTSVFAADPPVALLIQSVGTIEYSHDGTNWTPVRRNRYLFAGDRLRTGDTGGGSLIDQATNTVQRLAANSQVEIAGTTVRLVSGQLSPPEPAVGDLSAGLGNRFIEAQRYTTVRRSLSPATETIHLRLPNQVTLSQAFPELVWSGLGADYSYQLLIDGTVYPVAASADPIIRVRVPNLSPGAHLFSVDILMGGQSVARSEDEGTILWLSSAENAALVEKIAGLRAVAPGDDFIVANLLDQKGVSVAAMDLYRHYFDVYPDDNEMRPLLIRIYHQLKLSDHKQQELLIYQQKAARN